MVGHTLAVSACQRTEIRTGEACYWSRPVIDCHVFLGLASRPGHRRWSQWPSGSRGAGLGGTRLVVVSWKPARLGDDGCRVCRTKEDRSHNGTAERERLLRQLQHLRRAVPDEGPPGAGNSWRKVRIRSDCCGELWPAGLLTAGRGPCEGPNDHGHPHQHGEHG